jgi:hypothetical protein
MKLTIQQFVFLLFFFHQITTKKLKIQILFSCYIWRRTEFVLLKAPNWIIPLCYLLMFFWGKGSHIPFISLLHWKSTYLIIALLYYCSSERASHYITQSIYAPYQSIYLVISLYFFMLTYDIWVCFCKNYVMLICPFVVY